MNQTTSAAFARSALRTRPRTRAPCPASARVTKPPQVPAAPITRNIRSPPLSMLWTVPPPARKCPSSSAIGLDKRAGSVSFRGKGRRHNGRALLTDQLLHFPLNGNIGPENAKSVELRHYALRGIFTSASGTACLSRSLAIASMSLRSTTGTFAAGSGLSQATAMIYGSSRCRGRLLFVRR